MNIADINILLEEMKKYQNVILLGKESLVRILLRKLEKETGLDHVLVGSYHADQDGQKKVQGLPVTSMELLQVEKTKSLVVCLAPDEARQERIKTLLEKQGFSHAVWMDYDYMARLGGAENAPVKFIVAGYGAARAHLIETVISDNYEVYFPKRKESFYLEWKDQYDDAPERFQRIYLSGRRDNQVAGMILRDAYCHPEEVYETFGPDVKLIFVLRNPVNAAYAYYNQQMRRTDDENLLEYLRKHKRFESSIFEEYVDGEILQGRNSNFDYAYWLDEFAKKYPREQMLLITLEDMMGHTREVMNQVQEYIGVTPMSFTHIAQGVESHSVSKNYRCALSNQKLFREWKALAADDTKGSRKRFFTMKKRNQNRNMINTYERMTGSAREKLTNYYAPGVELLEKEWGCNVSNKFW